MKGKGSSPRLLIATTNPDKLREIGAVLGRLHLKILTLRDLPPVPEPVETGGTFSENARLKALYYDGCLPREGADRPLTVAEDSGLVIDALHGDPGVRSARFLRPDASYPERFAEINRRLAETPTRGRRARFVCALAVVHNGAVVHEATGAIEGEIARTPRGRGGFGYDPIFYYPPYGGTLAEATEEDKLRVAHRGEAFRQLAAWLEKGI